jgi:hypothetical protein
MNGPNENGASDAAPAPFGSSDPQSTGSSVAEQPLEVKVSAGAVAAAAAIPAEEFTPFTPTPEWLEAEGLQLPTPDWQERIAKRREETDRLMPAIIENVARNIAAEPFTDEQLAAQARADIAAMFGAVDEAPEPRGLAGLAFFRTAEHPKCPGTTIVSLPSYFPEGGATHVTCAILWSGCRDRTGVYAVIKRLWRRRLFPPNCYLVAAFAEGISIAMDGPEERVAELQAAVQRLQWSFPFRVVIARMDPREERLVESLDLGTQYPASDAGGAP